MNNECEQWCPSHMLCCPTSRPDCTFSLRQVVVLWHHAASAFTSVRQIISPWSQDVNIIHFRHFSCFASEDCLSWVVHTNKHKELYLLAGSQWGIISQFLYQRLQRVGWGVCTVEVALEGTAWAFYIIPCWWRSGHEEKWLKHRELKNLHKSVCSLPKDNWIYAWHKG